VKSNPKQHSCKKVCGPKEDHCEKCKIEGGSDGMLMAKTLTGESAAKF